ncbi:MAG: glycosyltransferase family 4 protein [Burkholderiaceae bacterium]
MKMPPPAFRPLHIVHTESSCGWGGQELRILVESRGMIARGHRVTLLAPVAARIFAEASRYRVPVIALPIEKKRLGAIGALRDWLRAHPVDVINTHSSTDSWVAALAWASLKHAPTIVRTRHISAPVPENIASRWLYRRACSYIVTTGASLRNALVARLRLDPSRVLSIPTGIDTTAFRPPTERERRAARAAIGVSDDDFIVGIVATLRSWKGHRYLIEGFADAMRMTSDGTANKMRLTIVGDGPQRQALEALVDTHRLRAHVRFAGNQPNVIPWLHAMDLFVLPSYANEGVPQAILQAMGCGVPVITTDAGAIGEIAFASGPDGDAGTATAWIARKENADDLRDAILALKTDTARCELMVNNALALVRTSHGIDGMLDRMEAVFRAAAGQAAIASVDYR